MYSADSLCKTSGFVDRYVVLADRPRSFNMYMLPNVAIAIVAYTVVDTTTGLCGARLLCVMASA